MTDAEIRRRQNQNHTQQRNAYDNHRPMTPTHWLLAGAIVFGIIVSLCWR